MIVVTIVAALVAAWLLLPGLSDLCSLVRGALRPAPPPPAPPLSDPPRFLFFVPAHDEELLIGACLRSLAALDYPTDRYHVVVVADNCRDGTVALARGAGIQCLERHDPDHPGKPQAIAWALPQLPLADFDAMVIVDADTVVAPTFAAALATRAPLRHKCLQAFNGVSNPSDSALTRMAAVLATAMHRFQFGMKNRAGLNVPMSAGMCLGTSVLRRFGWNAFSLCEDWELYAMLTVRGVRIESVPAARLLAQEASGLNQSASQRRRWMAGKVTVLLQQAPALLASGNIIAFQKLDALAELSAVGPAVHAGVVVAVSALLLLLQPPGFAVLAGAVGLSLLRPATYAAAALAVEPQPGRALLSFAYLPVYVVWRLGVSAAALRMLGDRPWVRTQRTPQAKESPAASARSTTPQG